MTKDELLILNELLERITPLRREGQMTNEKCQMIYDQCFETRAGGSLTLLDPLLGNLRLHLNGHRL